MVNFDSPAALGLLAEGGLGSVGGVGMGISLSGLGMSSLGMSASAMGRADEAEQFRRLQNIATTLKGRPGRVSKKGIEDLCEQEGITVELETSRRTKKVVNLVLLIGNEAAIILPVSDEDVVPDELLLQLTHDRHDYAATASKVLARSLKPLPGQKIINNTLERFSLNLGKLLRMDRLSSAQSGGVSCIQAISGLYGSLRKLFEHEKEDALKAIEAGTPFANQKAEREVLCKKSGRARFNANDCIGLSLEYWMDRRHLITKSSHQQAPSKGKDKMDIDSTAADEYPEDQDPETNKVYSLTIECEASPSSMYLPVRISDKWLSDSIVKAADAADLDMNDLLLNKPTIDWLEPEPTYLPAAATVTDNDAMNLDATSGRLPNIRFVARCNPPLVVPLTVFVTIQTTLGLEISNQDIRATTFVGLALRPDEPDPGLTGTAGETTQEVQAQKNILVMNEDGKEEFRTHTNSLYIPKAEYSRVIESLPFSHPRQLVELLPVLRQYAFTTSLLQHTFGTSSTPSEQTTKKSNSTPLSPPLTPPHSIAKQDDPLQIDLTLSYAHPASRLRLDIPHPSPPPSMTTTTSSTISTPLLTSLLSKTPSTPPLHVALDIHTNADLVITEQNAVQTSRVGAPNADVDAGESAVQGLVDEKVKRVARALDVCGDVGVWAEWVRREVVRCR
jgi:hypothetical protein